MSGPGPKRAIIGPDGSIRLPADGQADATPAVDGFFVPATAEPAPVPVRTRAAHTLPADGSWTVIEDGTPAVETAEALPWRQARATRGMGDPVMDDSWLLEEDAELAATPPGFPKPDEEPSEPAESEMEEEGDLVEDAWEGGAVRDEDALRIWRELRGKIQAVTQGTSEAAKRAVRTTRGTVKRTGKAVDRTRRAMQTGVREGMREGARQYAATAADGRVLGRELRAHGKGAARGTLRSVRRFLLQPVWVPTKRNPDRTKSRAALFAGDVVRFGGTFAVIFSALFFSLNYQSFWTIAKANLDPLSDLRPTKLQEEVRRNIEELGHVPSAPLSGELVSLVPTVGPPMNMLIIPKLDLRVPVVQPRTDNLVLEQWDALETDIQEALRNGVVHYPGSARPGQAGNFFVTGHSSYFPWDSGKFKSVFARLSALNPGDEYWVFYGGDKHRYIVQEKKEVKPSDVTVLDQPLKRRISTLMTCTPIGTTLRRLVIIAQEVDPDTGEPMAIGERAADDVLPVTKLSTLPI